MKVIVKHNQASKQNIVLHRPIEEDLVHVFTRLGRCTIYPGNYYFLDKHTYRYQKPQKNTTTVHEHTVASPFNTQSTYQNQNMIMSVGKCHTPQDDQCKVSRVDKKKT